jgi:hypothetical protein
MNVRLLSLFIVAVILLLITVAKFWYHVAIEAYLRSASPSARQCEFIYRKRKRNQTSVPSEMLVPPWLEKLTKPDAASSRPLHLTEENRGRFGNQMFAYASLFGIAWRNRRIPLFNDHRKICDVFRCRVPVVGDSAAIDVSK